VLRRCGLLTTCLTGLLFQTYSRLSQLTQNRTLGIIYAGFSDQMPFPLASQQCSSSEGKLPQDHVCLITLTHTITTTCQTSKDLFILQQAVDCDSFNHAHIVHLLLNIWNCNDAFFHFSSWFNSPLWCFPVSWLAKQYWAVGMYETVRCFLLIQNDHFMSMLSTYWLCVIKDYICLVS